LKNPAPGAAFARLHLQRNINGGARPADSEKQHRQMERQFDGVISAICFDLQRGIDAAGFPPHTRRMAKKSEAKPTAKTQRRQENPDHPQMPQNSADSEKKSVQSAKSAEVSSLRASAPLRLKSSSLLDTRVIYCGDNLEQPKRMKKEEGRMMKPAHPLFLHSSFFLLPSPVPASHYVKVMLDQIFGNCKCNCA
jgi:hypothetical protein